MITLFTNEEYENAKSSDLLPLKCELCGKIFYSTKKYIKCCFTNSNYKNKNRFCSNECKNKNNITSIKKQCTNCNKEIYVTPSMLHKSKTNSFFCSKSCSAHYNNTHKKIGVRRSKLEMYIEEKLTEQYPNLDILYNSKKIINSELDIYIPSLKLAFELNGLFHYEPIFGNKKLELIKENDNNKFQKCQEQKISLCIIDTSSQKYFKEQTSIKFLNIIKNIIDEKLQQLAE
jgi:hypothetical protein